MEIPLMYSSSLFGDYRRAIGIPVIHCNSKQGMETKCNVPALGLWLSRSAVPCGIIPKHPLSHCHLNRIPGKMALGEACRCFAFQNYKRLGRASQTQENPMFFLENHVTWWDTHSTSLPPQSDLKKKRGTRRQHPDVYLCHKVSSDEPGQAGGHPGPNPPQAGTSDLLPQSPKSRRGKSQHWSAAHGWVSGELVGVKLSSSYQESVCMRREPWWGVWGGSLASML